MMSNFDKIFISAIENRDIQALKLIPKSRHCPVNLLEEWIAPFLEKDCFFSIDLYGDEMAQPIKNFKSIYRKAKEKGLILKAHVGEWGCANSVKEAVEELELNEVQHGISAYKKCCCRYRSRYRDTNKITCT